MNAVRSPLGAAVVASLGLAIAASAGSVAHLTAGAGGSTARQAPLDLRPTAADREVARDLMRALAIGFENVAADPAASATPELKSIRSFLDRLPRAAREGLLGTARRFSAQGEQGLRTFYGPLYSATPQGRLRNLPAAVRSLQARKKLVVLPVRPPGVPQAGLPRPSVSAIQGLGLAPPVRRDTSFAASDRDSGLNAAQKFGTPHEVRLDLALQAIRVNALNDDDTPDDEVYLGVWAVPGPPSLIRVPATDYWRFTRGQTRTLNASIRNFGAVETGHAYAAFVSVFELDDGTWGEIWSAFVQVAEFAFDTYLQAEIGVVAAEIVNYFLNDLWGWIAGWFENADDFIDGAVVAYDFAREPRFWAPGPSGGAQVSQERVVIASGADANYRLTFRWTLKRVSVAR